MAGSREPPAHGPSPERRKLALWAALAVCAAAVVGGLGAVIFSVEPDTTFLGAKPWLVLIGDEKIGVEFITYGSRYSAVLFGILDRSGNWVSLPAPLSPLYGTSTYPSSAFSVEDSAGRIHVSWSLYDTAAPRQVFHYLQLDVRGRVVVRADAIGNASIGEAPFPVLAEPWIRPEADRVGVFWSSNGTYQMTVLGLDGSVIAPPSPAPEVNDTWLPSRSAIDGGTWRDSKASVRSDALGNTLYLWQRLTYSRSGPVLLDQYEVRLRRVGPSGDLERAVYSTDDWWWATKPAVLPAVVAMLVGAAASAVIVARAGPLRTPRLRDPELRRRRSFRLPRLGRR